jgi:hypothetical protein
MEDSALLEPELLVEVMEEILLIIQHQPTELQTQVAVLAVEIQVIKEQAVQASLYLEYLTMSGQHSQAA